MSVACQLDMLSLLHTRLISYPTAIAHCVPNIVHAWHIDIYGYRTLLAGFDYRSIMNTIRAM